MNRCLEKLRRQFDEAGVHYEVLEHELAFTAQHVADVEHVPGHTLVKSVVAIVEGKPCLLALPAPHVVDFAALRLALDAKASRLASESELEGLFPDCEVGTMPPFPGPSDVAVYLDKALVDIPEIVFEAGSYTQSIRMRTEDYIQLVAPRVLGLGREPEGPEPESKTGEPR